jgi:hypothetical protein
MRTFSRPHLRTNPGRIDTSLARVARLASGWVGPLLARQFSDDACDSTTSSPTLSH